jgi:hypothetical protein
MAMLMNICMQNLMQKRVLVVKISHSDVSISSSYGSGASAIASLRRSIELLPMRKQAICLSMLVLTRVVNCLVEAEVELCDKLFGLRSSFSDTLDGC